jgi:hypothetical protein
MAMMSGLPSRDVETSGSDGPHPVAKTPAVRSPRERPFGMIGKRISKRRKRIKGGE